MEEENPTPRDLANKLPGKRSGEYKHGYAPDLTHPSHPAQYSIYWAVYILSMGFSDGVANPICENREARNFNYIN
jgi:rhamnogalacturonan endolyase